MGKYTDLARKYRDDEPQERARATTVNILNVNINNIHSNRERSIGKLTSAAPKDTLQPSQPVETSQNDASDSKQGRARGEAGVTRLRPTTLTTLFEADRLGLIARWSKEFGYISLHDPTSGEWHDLRTEDAPDWAKREAFKRRDLYRSGNRKAYRLTAREMEEMWEAERVPEGIIEDYPIEEEE